MKYKLFYYIIILLATQICICQNSISISNSSGANNTEIEISVSIDNVKTFTGFQFDITLPTDILFISNSLVISNRAVNHSINASVINGNTLRFIGFSPSNTNFNGINGEIFKFRLKPNALIATYPLNVTNGIISNISGGNIVNNIVNGSLQVLANNESNIISIGNAVGYNYSEIEIPVLINNTQALHAFQFDITLPNNINYIENSITQTSRFTNHVLSTSLINGNILRVVAYSPTNANITGSTGEVFRFRIRSISLAGSYPLNINNGIVSNVTFGNVLTNVINGTLVIHQSNERNIFTIGNLSGNNNTEIEIPVSIENTQTFSAFEFDVTLPNNISYVANSIVISNRAVNHSISASLINENTLRFKGLSPTNTNFNGANGEIFKFRLKPNTLISTYPLNITNGIISNILDGNIVSNIVNGSLQVLANNESNVISIGKAVGYNYSEIEIPVLINNTQALHAFQFDITLPNNINYIENSITQTSRFTNHVLSTSLINGNILRVVAYSPTNANITGSTGEVFRFRIRSISLAGSYPLNINNGIVSNVTFGNVLTSVINGTLAIRQSNEKNILIIGNSSGTSSTEIEIPVSIENTQTFSAFEFDITLPNNISFVANSIVISNRAVDHTVTANLVNGNTLRFKGLSQTNINFDGTNGEIFKFRLKPSVSQGIYPLLSNNAKLVNSNLGNIITNEANGQVEILAQNVISPNYLLVENQQGYKNQLNVFSIALKNNDVVRAVQFDVELPSGFNLIPSNITTTARSAGFTVSASLLSGNTYRVLLYSLSNLSLSIGDRAILNFPITLSSTLNTGTYSFIYSNVVISNASNQNVSSTALEEGKISVTNALIGLNIKLYLQGPYVVNTGLMTNELRNRGLIPTKSPYFDAITAAANVFNLGGRTSKGLAQNDIVDWVWVELRDKNNNSTIIESKSALLQRDGDVVDIDGISSLSFISAADNYYIMIRHRNHLGIITASSLSISSTFSSIDFTTNSLLVLGRTNGIAAIGNGKFALFAGDYNGDGQVQNADKNAVETLRGISGYSNADIDMNSEVQNAEINSVLNPNIGKGKQF